MEQLDELMSMVKMGPYGLMSIIIGGSLICYLSIKPIIRWCVLLKQDRVLSYVLCSLIVFISTISIGVVFFKLNHFYLIKVSLLCMAVFGGILVFTRLIQYLYQAIFTKKA